MIKNDGFFLVYFWEFHDIQLTGFQCIQRSIHMLENDLQQSIEHCFHILQDMDLDTSD